MPRAVAPFPIDWTIANLLEELGGIDPARIRLVPLPGTATAKDVVAIEKRENRLYELIDGVLVEKVMGFKEAFLASVLVRWMGNFAEEHDLGIAVGADGMVKLFPDQVRIPDAAFFSWALLPGRVVPEHSVPELVPDLAVEVLSEGNTAAEMRRKLKEYFLAGTQLVWIVDPKARTVRVFTAPDESTLLRERQTLDGGKVLPGFSLPLAQLFAQLPKRNGKK